MLRPEHCSHPAVSKTRMKISFLSLMHLACRHARSINEASHFFFIFFFHFYKDKEKSKGIVESTTCLLPTRQEGKAELSGFGGISTMCVSLFLSFYLRCQDADSEDEMFHTASFLFNFSFSLLSLKDGMRMRPP